MDKKMITSATFWGVFLSQIGRILMSLSELIQGQMVFGDFLQIALTGIGIIIAGYGARRAVGKMIANGR